ncbi:MAG: anthranilate synthase component I, partial [Calditrichaeota bacterium]
ELAADYRQAQQALDELEAALRRPVPEPPRCEADLAQLSALPDRPTFLAAVRRAKEYILAGDIFQVVLSRRFCLPFAGDAFAFYRALRNVNPSPYMFFLDLGSFQLIGSSPEALITVQERRAEIVPIAGTRPRGADEAEDARLAEELRADQKEQAEHVMLVDLARNDLSRVCTPGSVQVEDFQTVERYSHVMHLISRVHGQLQPNRSAIDALMAAFPAGTVSGAPKIRAMEIIHELEPVKRGFYAGAVGYIDYSGNLDMCITIRSVLARHGQLVFQAGAGIVADSVPEREFEECTNKARALEQAVQLASEGIHDLVHR